ncbi:hypothetical protein EPUS_05901 [Endocarpon pusillum Z07020]|uniref:Uncharacterized protein n=1 Tax=Endocarpon pusillum (strain Z07020 / HMAS-L-300199) TaxID=1263415 RepID=U1HWU7_ENDPU|nr:uncharacterized protein EPUS_05901 [Endocarpon pusillum Z07020]ERF73889.1 hypothetical protein EPUS_05901 [Endocarpon pusillum Z07020]
MPRSRPESKRLEFGRLSLVRGEAAYEEVFVSWEGGPWRTEKAVGDSQGATSNSIFPSFMQRQSPGQAEFLSRANQDIYRAPGHTFENNPTFTPKGALFIPQKQLYART